MLSLLMDCDNKDDQMMHQNVQSNLLASPLVSVNTFREIVAMVMVMLMVATVMMVFGMS